MVRPMTATRRAFLKASGVLSGMAITGTANAQQSNNPQLDLNTDWAHPRYSTAQTGYSPEAHPPTERALQQVRSLGPKADLLEEPVILDEVVYMASKESKTIHITATDMGGGQRNWSTEFNDDTYAPETQRGLCTEGSVLCASGGTHLIAVDNGTGDILWNKKNTHSPTIAGDRIFAAQGPPPISRVALDISSGETIWKTQTKLTEKATAPTVVDGTAYYVGEHGVDALATSDGSVQWHHPYENRVTQPYGGRPAFTDDVLVVTNKYDRFVGIDASNGAQLWQKHFSHLSGIAAANGSVYCGIGSIVGVGLMCFDAQTGQKDWEQPVGNVGIPSVANGIVFVPIIQPHRADDDEPPERRGLIGVSAETGELQLTFLGVDSSLDFAPVIAGNAVLFPTDSNYRFVVRKPPTNNAPSAAISYKPSAPTVGEEVTFDASSSSDSDGSLASFEWQIAGSSASGKTVTKTFSTAGQKEIKLTITDDDGATASDSRTILIEES